MDCVEGFSFGNRIRCALDQSRYSVESCISQNARSWASVLNLGIDLSLLFIEAPFLAVHIAGGDWANFPSLKSQGESNMQQPSPGGLPQGMKARLSLAVLQVRNEDKRHVEKDLLDLGLADMMFVFALALIACIPIEPFDLLEVDHRCIFS